MSIWGKRVDAWFNKTTGTPTEGDYNRLGVQLLAVLVVAVLVALLIALNGSN
jgi:hypothetical protein